MRHVSRRTTAAGGISGPWPQEGRTSNRLFGLFPDVHLPDAHRSESMTYVDGTHILDDEPSQKLPLAGGLLDAGDSLKRRVVLGSAWTVFGFAAAFVLRLTSNVILTRLLFPEAFGLMTLVGVLMTGLAMFSDIGVGPSIIQNRRGDDPRFLNTAWTIQVGRGVLLWVCAIALAPLMAGLYEEPRLRWMVPIAGLSAVFAGFSSTSLFLLNRHLRLGRRTVLDLATQFVGIVVTVAWAWVDRSVNALVAGMLVAPALKAILSHVVIPGPRNRLAWDREAGRSLFRFGRWIFLNTLLAFIGIQADRLLLGKLISMEMLGVYGIAAALVMTGRSLVLSLSGSVLFPAASRRSGLPREQFLGQLRQKRRPILLLSAAMMAVVVSCEDWVVLGLYDARYEAASWILPILTLGLWPVVLAATADGCLLALDQSKYLTLGSFLRVLAVCVLLPLGYRRFGLPGVVVSMSVVDWPRYIGAVIGLVRARLNLLRQDALATGLLVLLLLALWWTRHVLSLGTPIGRMF